jgi:hypothetical protein
MAAVDQQMRTPPPEEAHAFSRPLTVEQRMRCARVDVGNADRLRAIIDEHGWPGKSLVGEEGAMHAWLLAQHADRQLDFQRRALSLLAVAVERSEATSRQLAYLTDRVRMNEGREQLYGTQIADVEDGRAVPWPVESPDQLDERRERIGLEPFAEYPPNRVISRTSTNRLATIAEASVVDVRHPAAEASLSRTPSEHRWGETRVLIKGEALQED